ncbi:disease resistance protein RPV1-like [Syzygium oleosum]|uniref:disease resistance protein RPV1-like n=1 Tax=Syzygium oleosum TaxID=219896 RepID=UPI0011D27ED4|nr:disease resistance protein RPV1-like [Syzygium oleosum]
MSVTADQEPRMPTTAAGTSSDATALGAGYQVFLSFRGPDTRHGFADYLYHALVGAGVRVFRDDEELRVGEKIGGALLRAIDDSKLYIPIFSRSYAASKWCLRELARIVDNTSRSKGNKKILPIFFDVEPDDVKLKTSLYSDALVEHQKKFPDEVKAWREALVEVDKIKGWNLKKNRGQGELTKLVVEEVLDKLKTKHRYVTEHLIGMDDRVAAIKKLLDIHAGGVRLVGIYGMGGIGKTTLANVIFNQLSSEFGNCGSFLNDIREESKKDGLVKLQAKLISDIVNSRVIGKIDDIGYGMRRIEETLCNKKALIVLDDVDKSEQIEKLIGSSLHSGTRIIITTRNRSLLQVRGFKYEILDYEMREMNSKDALQLFSRHAFCGDSPPGDYNKLSKEIVCVAGGLPLALEVIGSLLYCKEEAIWIETLDKLRNIPEKEVQRKLKISYDVLDEFQQHIFLDIACFFINEGMNDPIYMWTDCRFFPKRGIEVLINMSLIKILKNNKLWMHDQLRDLGREIVRQESPIDPEKRSRLWIREEILDVISSEERKGKVQGLDLDGRHTQILLTNEEFERFPHLRLLKLCNGTFVGDFANCRTKLRWMSWDSPPPDVMVANMYLQNVIVLKLSTNHFNDSDVWGLIKMACKLKVLSLQDCPSITRTPNVSGCSTLERLTLQECENLMTIDCSIGMLKCLVDLDIDCCPLEELPDVIGGLVTLKRLSLKRCFRLRKLPESIGKLRCLLTFDISYTSINELPDSVGGLPKLEFLSMESTKIKELPKPILKWALLRELDLSFAKIIELPESIGNLKMLKVIRVGYNPIKKFPHALGTLKNLEELHAPSCKLEGEIPTEIGELSMLRIFVLRSNERVSVPRTIVMLPLLQMLDLNTCSEIQELPELPSSLTDLVLESRSLRFVPDLSNLTNLVRLVLSDGSLVRGTTSLRETCDMRWLRSFSKLNELNLCLLNIPAPPTELGSLSFLEKLTLYGLDLQSLTELPSSLLYLRVHNFSSAGLPISNLRKLSTFRLSRSEVKEILLDGLHQLSSLSVSDCELLERLSFPSSINEISVIGCPKLVEIHFPGVLESLERLGIERCESFERSSFLLEQGCDELTFCGGRLSLLSSAFKKLKEFSVVECPKLVEIQVVGILELLEIFSVDGCLAMERLGGLSNLKNLKSLSMRECSALRAVEGLDQLECLCRLLVGDYGSLERWIDVSSAKIPDECEMLIWDCRGSSSEFCPRKIECVSFNRYRETILLGPNQRPWYRFLCCLL